MTRFVAAVLGICLLAYAAGVMPMPPAETEETLIRVYNKSGTEMAYIRLDYYVEDDYRGCIASCPNEGEDFYRFPLEGLTQEEMDNLRLEWSYGISDLAPEEAVLQLMTGNPAEEHELTAPRLSPIAGRIYTFDVVQALNGPCMALRMDQPEDEREWTAPEAPGQDEQDEETAALLKRLTEFFRVWNRNRHREMLELCAEEWKEAQTQEPLVALFTLLANRTPLDLTVETVHGDAGDRVRTVTATSHMDRNNGKAPVWYRCQIVMKKGPDGLWYVDPDFMRAYELVEEEVQEEPTPAPEETEEGAA